MKNKTDFYYIFKKLKKEFKNSQLVIYYTYLIYFIDIKERDNYIMVYRVIQSILGRIDR
jgi:hypothetical protein